MSENDGWALAIHGGAGVRLDDPNREKMLRTLGEALTDASSLLRRGGAAVDAVERAVYIMEDSALFNAGRGSCLTSDGRAELDAGICRGSDLATGAVARVTDYAHPVEVARFVMERTNMIGMYGNEALELMELYRRVERENLATAAKLERLRKGMDGLSRSSFSRRHHPKDTAIVLENPRYRRLRRIGTVGAVAVDRTGETAAADSTGGYWMKLRGRMGDSPIFGAGFYADGSGAATATGVGEYAVRCMLARTAVEKMHRRGARDALTATFRELERRFGSDNAGMIAVDRNCTVGIHHNTEGMGHAFLTGSMRRMVVRMTTREGGRFRVSPSPPRPRIAALRRVPRA